MITDRELSLFDASSTERSFTEKRTIKQNLNHLYFQPCLLQFSYKTFSTTNNRYKSWEQFIDNIEINDSDSE